MAEEQSLKMIRLEITDLEWLYKSYMSFVLGGGIFFFSNENFNIGDGILFVLTLKIDKIERKYPIRTEIIWKDERNGGVTVSLWVRKRLVKKHRLISSPCLISCQIKKRNARLPCNSR